MDNFFDAYRPQNFHTVTPYLFVDKPQILIDFLKNAFLAEEINRSLDSKTGDILNCILQIGDSCFMISQARGKHKGMKTALYLFVNDVEAIHKRAIKYGAKIEFEPSDMPYGDRQSGIIDPCGNFWWISKRLLQKSYQE